MFSDYFADKTPILSSRILVMSEKKNVGLQGFPAALPMVGTDREPRTNGL